MTTRGVRGGPGGRVDLVVFQSRTGAGEGGDRSCSKQIGTIEMRGKKPGGVQQSVCGRRRDEPGAL